PGPTPPPSAMPEVEDAAPPERARGLVPRPPPPPARRSPPLALIAGGVGLALAIGVAGVVVVRSMRVPAIESITPARVGLGQSVVITGAHFASAAAANVVQFGGRPGRVVQASDTRLQVEIPEIPVPPGRDLPVPVVVTADGRESKPSSVAVFLAPRIHGIAPAVAMPGDEVVLAGSGWGAGARVQFGGAAATVLDSSPTSLRVRVPALEGAPGREFPVTVAMGADASNPAPFLIGHLPLVLSVSPPSAAPGDMVTVSGRGFEAQAPANDVRVGGARALVIGATGSEIRLVVPRAAAGEAAVEVRVPAAANVGQGSLTVVDGPDPIDFRFVAEPFEDKPGHDHAVLATGLGPAFVLSGGGGRSSAERASDAQRKLNEAAATLRASLHADVRARGLDGSPVLVLVGKDTPLLEVTLDDAAAYEEDWTGLKGRGGDVTPARLATWWEAVARDLVLVLVRGERPHFAADLAAEGRVFAELHAAARKTVATGVPRQVVAEARPALRDALRITGLRVPASVKGPSSAPDAPSPAVAAGPALRLEGRWSGTETESGRLKYVSASFAGEASTFTYERALSLTVPLLGLQRLKDAVRFSVQTGTGPRHYQGRWDGQKLSGTISVDAGGRTPVGTFELAPR
ncbi:MAG TPA: IPT/TIG domain-containing protein, partial [Vicinamibacteria bacterium]|nr:IPT/TIG domain-containing protein [Vicinamibacteria bacterium]